MGILKRVKFTNVDASPRQMVTNTDYVPALVGYHLDNPNSTECYVKFFTETSGSVTLGTTAPHFGPIKVPANSQVVEYYGTESSPMRFFNEYICVAATDDDADTASTFTGSQDITVELIYYGS